MGWRLRRWWASADPEERFIYKLLAAVAGLDVVLAVCVFWGTTWTK